MDWLAENEGLLYAVIWATCVGVVSGELVYGLASFIAFSRLNHIHKSQTEILTLFNELLGIIKRVGEEGDDEINH